MDAITGFVKSNYKPAWDAHYSVDYKSGNPGGHLLFSSQILQAVLHFDRELDYLAKQAALAPASVLALEAGSPAAEIESAATVVVPETLDAAVPEYASVSAGGTV